jgi:hypothetical protein
MAMTQSERDAEDAIWDADSVSRNAKAEIKRLEAEITPRRVRESILGTDGGWLAAQEALIATEWATYREARRRSPVQQSDPDDIVFPTEPT